MVKRKEIYRFRIKWMLKTKIEMCSKFGYTVFHKGDEPSKMF